MYRAFLSNLATEDFDSSPPSSSWNINSQLPVDFPAYLLNRPNAIPHFVPEIIFWTLLNSFNVTVPLSREQIAQRSGIYEILNNWIFLPTVICVCFTALYTCYICQWLLVTLFTLFFLCSMFNVVIWVGVVIYKWKKNLRKYHTWGRKQKY